MKLFFKKWDQSWLASLDWVWYFTCKSAMHKDMDTFNIVYINDWSSCKEDNWYGYIVEFGKHRQLSNMWRMLTKLP